MKAYRVAQDRATLFRPLKHWERLNRSAERLCMPSVPKALFMEGVQSVTAFVEKLIPRASGQSLYLRPCLLGVDEDMGLAESSDVSFYVMASPSESIAPGSMGAMVEREYSRAAYGGTGAVKVGGNYASALAASQRTRRAGFNQTLWLDPKKRRYVEELSGMNFFAVVDGKLITPALSGSILPGVTRDSIITLAHSLGLEVDELEIDIDWLINAIDHGRCREAFASGTAISIAPITNVGEADGSLHTLACANGPVTKMLKTHLADIQEGRIEDPFSWMNGIPSQHYP